VHDCLFGWDTQGSCPTPPRAICVGFWFCTVRNPWDRMISLWDYFNRPDNLSPNAGGPGKPRSLEETIAVVQAKSFSSTFTWPFTGFIPELRGSVTNLQFHGFPASIYPLQKMDKILRFERLSADWNDLGKVLGIVDKLPHFNQGDRGHYSQYYDAKLKDRVAKIYAADIKQFDYEFEQK